jgi:hypothetical protein
LIKDTGIQGDSIIVDRRCRFEMLTGNPGDVAKFVGPVLSRIACGTTGFYLGILIPFLSLIFFCYASALLQ